VESSEDYLLKKEMTELVAELSEKTGIFFNGFVSSMQTYILF